MKNIGSRIGSFAGSFVASVQANWGKSILTTVAVSGLNFAVPHSWRSLAIIAVSSFVLGTLFWARWGQMVKFFESRAKSPRLMEDSANATEVWAAWYTGTTVGASGEVTRTVGQKLTRVLLITPDPKGYLGTFAGLFEGITIESLESDIRRAGQRLLLAGVKEVKFFNGPLLGMVIFNPYDLKRGWIRVEPMAPHLEANDRPIIIVEARRHKQAFIALRDSYDATWRSPDGTGEAPPAPKTTNQESL